MRLLIVGQLKGHIGTASRIALSRGAKISYAEDIQAALIVLRAGKGTDLLMVDIAIPIADLIKAMTLERFSIPVIACGLSTGQAEAVAAINAGAQEYIPLPPDAELIAAVLENVTREENTLIHRDIVMKNIIKIAKQIAPSDASIMITGESGTGKEVMARYIHNNSRRKNQNFVSVNCAAIPENLLESELFGHEKGAFTGAIARRIGKFEEANNGTLLLDEISEMQLSMQAKLLRAIQEREIDRVGGTKPVPVNLRIVATSNRDLEEEVKKGNFREDLYFRLNVVPLHLPPLRKRPLDLELLAEHFIKKHSEANGLEIKSLSPNCRQKIREHMWKGNIRELGNVMHRAVLLSQGSTIESDDLNLKPDQDKIEPAIKSTLTFPTSNNMLIGRTVSDVERDLIIGTLSHCFGNRMQAAHILGISIRTLRNKINQYNTEGFSVPPTSESIQKAG